MLQNLSPQERDALLELSRTGPGGNFDQATMSKLFTLELVEVNPMDRRLVLTADGRSVLRQLLAESD